MNNILKTLLFTLIMLSASLVQAIDYPTYRGSKSAQNNNNDQVVVPLRNSPLPKPNGTYRSSAKSYDVSVSAGTSGSGLGTTESSGTLHSYGGGGSAGSVSTGRSASSPAYQSSGSGSLGVGGSIPRVKSLTDGSQFESVERPILASPEEPTLLREGAGPPPPGPGGNTQENKLPLGSGMLMMMICSTIFGIHKHNQIEK